MVPTQSGEVTDIDKALAAVKSPMIFNALAIIVFTSFAWHLSTAGTVNWPIAWSGLGFITAVTIWLNVFAAINPRFLAYGPQEYLRESEMAHERRMKGIM